MNAIDQAKNLISEIRKHPDRWEVNLAAAERVLRQAALDQPKDYDVLTCLGAVLSDEGKHEEATHVLRRAIDAGSKDRNAYFNLGVALINYATHEEAMLYMKQTQSLAQSNRTWEAYFDPQAC